jgi:predicted thioesterase
MYRTGNNVEIKLRLNEINRRSIALSTTCSELANLAAQLDHLRQVNERFSHLAIRLAHSKRRQGNYLSREPQG